MSEPKPLTEAKRCRACGREVDYIPHYRPDQMAEYAVYLAGQNPSMEAPGCGGPIADPNWKPQRSEVAELRDALSKAEARAAERDSLEMAADNLAIKLTATEKALSAAHARAEAAEARVNELEAKLKRFEGYVRCFTADGWAEHQQAAESRATQLARALKAARAWVASFPPSEDRATDLGIIDAALSLAAPQGAPKKGEGT